MSQYFISWSGGKDSCLALQHAVSQFGKPRFLLTMMTEDGKRSRSHGLAREIIEAQATCLEVTPRFYSTSWEHYEQIFGDALIALRREKIAMGVFGDIKISDDPIFSNHRKFADSVCANATMIAHEPLWQLTEADVMEQFLSSGISATIIAAKENCAAASFLGARLTRAICHELAHNGVHPLGERGEFHTVVTNSPLFAKPLELLHGEQLLRDGYWFLDVSIGDIEN